MRTNLSPVQDPLHYAPLAASESGGAELEAGASAGAGDGAGLEAGAEGEAAHEVSGRSKSSQYRGVHRRLTRAHWQASISMNGKHCRSVRCTLLLHVWHLQARVWAVTRGSCRPGLREGMSVNSEADAVQHMC